MWVIYQGKIQLNISRFHKSLSGADGFLLIVIIFHTYLTSFVNSIIKLLPITL